MCIFLFSYPYKNTLLVKGNNATINKRGGFSQLWRSALIGPSKQEGISHEKFVERLVKDHMRNLIEEYRFISNKLWNEALSNPIINGMKVVPHPIIGFDQLQERIQVQRKSSNELLRIAETLKKLARANRNTLIKTKLKIEEQRKKQLELRQKTIEVMKLVERLHHWNKPTTKNEILFRERINGLHAELNLPHRFRGQLGNIIAISVIVVVC
jgi:hypothetical protein